MNNITRLNYLSTYISNFFDFFITKNRCAKSPQTYFGKKIMEQNDGSNYIEKLISYNKPFAIARFGAVECGCFNRGLEIKLGLVKQFKQTNFYQMQNNAGFFSATNNELLKFTQLQEKCFKEIDLLAVFNIFMEDYIVNHFCKNAKLTTLITVDPVLSSWTKSLRGKKVLVVHPLAELIQQQYKKRELLFEDKDKLPDFHLKVFPAVQTIAGEKDDRFNSWFEALDYMIDEISKIEFDIALIGAGAYGLPLAVKIKTQLRKQAIHIGGATQLLFGIRGKRWDIREDFAGYFNEYWVRPDKKYIPQNAQGVEGGCYW